MWLLFGIITKQLIDTVFWKDGLKLGHVRVNNQTLFIVDG
jgi:hypothetical protein